MKGLEKHSSHRDKNKRPLTDRKEEEEKKSEKKKSGNLGDTLLGLLSKKPFAPVKPKTAVTTRDSGSNFSALKTLPAPVPAPVFAPPLPQHSMVEESEVERRKRRLLIACKNDKTTKHRDARDEDNGHEDVDKRRNELFRKIEQRIKSEKEDTKQIEAQTEGIKKDKRKISIIGKNDESLSTGFKKEPRIEKQRRGSIISIEEGEVSSLDSEGSKVKKKKKRRSRSPKKKKKKRKKNSSREKSTNVG